MDNIQLVYAGPVLGATVSYKGATCVVSATRGTSDGGNFVSFDCGQTFVPVAELDAAEALQATAAEKSAEPADQTAAPAPQETAAAPAEQPARAQS